MSFYCEQVLKIKAAHYPDDELCRQVIQAKHYIDAHFFESINLKRIAGQAFYSRYHFLRLFKNLYGTTPHQYLTSVRIGKAKQLLQTNMSVAAVCMAVGFDSISSFKGLFKKHTGLTPTCYQKSRQSRGGATTSFRFFPFCMQEKKQFSRRSLTIADRILR